MSSAPILLALLLCILYMFWPPMRKLKTPGPRPLPFIGHGFRGRHRHRNLLAWFRQYKVKILHTFMPVTMKNAFIVGDANIAREVFSDQKQFYARESASLISILFPHSMAGLPDGDEWKLHRKLITAPMVNTQYLMKYLETINGKIDTTCRLISAQIGDEKKTTVAMHERLTLLTLDVIYQLAFGYDSNCQVKPDNRVNAIKRAAFLGVIVLVVPYRIRKFLKLDEYVHRLMKPVHDLATQAIENTAPGSIFEAMVLASDPDSAAKFSQMDLLDESTAILLAGHESTSNALTWACYYLAKEENRAVKEKLVAELEEVLQDPNNITFEQLDKLVYTQAVVTETLRLSPPAYATTRTARNDCVLDGVHIEKGSSVLLSPYIMNRNPEYWPEPEVFNPERHIEGRALSTKKEIHVFGGGGRLCIGKRIALLEATAIIARLWRRYDMQVAPGFVPKDELLGAALISANGLMVQVAERK